MNQTRNKIDDLTSLREAYSNVNESSQSKLNDKFKRSVLDKSIKKFLPFIGGDMKVELDDGSFFVINVSRFQEK